jgi:hypothetical protein
VLSKRKQRETEREEREQHARMCTGLRLRGFMATVDGQQFRIITGELCECARGRWIAERGPDALELATANAARRRGPTWITRAEFERRHFQAAGVPDWGAGVIQSEP